MRSIPKPKAALLGGLLAAAAGLLAFTLAKSEAPSVAAPVVPQQQTAPPEAPAPAEQPAPAPAASAEGLVLYGISGGGAAGKAAVIGGASGFQRVVPLGRDYRPGLRLKAVGDTYVLLAASGTDYRLELNRAGAIAVAAAAPPAAATPLPAAAANMSAIKVRLGFEPVKAQGRTSGYRLKSAADLPALARAGLRPGDVLLAVNGVAFDSAERLEDLPREIAGSYTAEFEYERGGRRMEASLPVNPRPQT